MSTDKEINAVTYRPTDLVERLHAKVDRLPDATDLMFDLADIRALLARLAEVEAERDAARARERDVWDRINTYNDDPLTRLKALALLDGEYEAMKAKLADAQLRRDTWHAMWQEVRRELEAAEQALATIALDCVPPANRVTYVLSPAEIRDLAVARLTELAVARSVVEAADAWRGENNGKGLVLPPTSDRIDALIAAVDLHRSIRNLDSAVPEPSFATETLPTTGEKP